MENRINVLKKALEKDPDNPLGLYGLAVELFKEKRYDEAILYLHKYLEKHQDEGSAYRLLAQSYARIGNLEKAVEYYKKGIEKAEKHNHPSMVKEFELEIKNLQERLKEAG
ncbi:MAG: tetratricopeptide repeat protein [Aquificae bacterium]|nr:tetratricopeptide repeat protein [Aquificota bacterium]